MKRALMYQIDTDQTLDPEDPAVHPMIRSLIEAGYMVDMSALMWSDGGRTIKPNNVEAGRCLGGIKLRTLSGDVILMEMYEQSIFFMVPEKQDKWVRDIFDTEPQWDMEYSDERIFNPFLNI